MMVLTFLMGWRQEPPRANGVLASADGQPAAYATALPSPPSESVQDELVRLQRQFGLTLVNVDSNAVQFVDFSKHTLRKLREFPGGGWISRDGSEVATTIHLGTRWYPRISRPDGSGLREYPGVVDPTDFCWSLDGSRLALRATIHGDTRRDPPRLWILDVNLGTTRDTGADGRLTPQCWSPDAKQIAYSDANASFVKNSNVRVLDLAAHTSRTLAKGVNPTWSPDGNWIAFYDQGTYYSIRPAGGESKKLFKKWHATSGLLWSPDCRIVAFVSQAGVFEGQLPTIDIELYWLRARRLADGSETRLVGSFEDPQDQWLAGPEFIPK